MRCLCCTSAAAQDTRTVTEPTIPPVCATLRAQLVAPHGIEPADETKLDTERLQSAIDGCAPGKALELAADGAKDAFLSGPIELRKGVTLLIDKGVTLYGSRNPDDYATRPGSCGVVNNERGGLPSADPRRATPMARASWVRERSTAAAERSCS